MANAVEPKTMTHLWRTVVFVLLVMNIGSIALTFALGRILPDSPQISFQFGRGNSRSLYLLDIDHPLVFQVARGTNPFPSIAWSPDGKQLTYAAQVNDHADIFRLDIECASLLTLCGTPVNLTQNLSLIHI